jgi:hypothetical protein
MPTVGPKVESNFYLKGCHKDIMSDVNAPDYQLETEEVPLSQHWMLCSLAQLVNGAAFRSFAERILGPGPSQTRSIDVRLIHSGDDIEIRRTPEEIPPEDLKLKPFLVRLFSSHAPYENGPNQDWVPFGDSETDKSSLSERVQKLEIAKQIDRFLRALFFAQYADDSKFQYYQRNGGNGWCEGYRHATVEEAKKRFEEKIRALQAGTPIQDVSLCHADDVSAWYDWSPNEARLKPRPYPDQEICRRNVH